MTISEPRSSKFREALHLDTSNILFIASGAFDGMGKIVRERKEIKVGEGGGLGEHGENGVIVFSLDLIAYIYIYIYISQLPHLQPPSQHHNHYNSH